MTRHAHEDEWKPKARDKGVEGLSLFDGEAPIAQTSEKAPVWFVVRAGTPAALCSTCHAEVYWIITPAGRRMPVDCNVTGGHAPERRVDGAGLSHFATCPDADEHRRSR